MKVSKEQIIFVSLIVAMLGACAAVFIFYFKPRLEKYKEDERIAEQMLQTYEQFEREFDRVVPTDLIGLIRSRTQPWMDSRLEWGEPFNVGDWLVRAKPRPEEQFPKFYYAEESERLLSELRDSLRAKLPGFDYTTNANGVPRYPAALRADIGVPGLEDWNNVEEVTDEMVNRQLRKLSFGIAVYELLVKYDPAIINNVEVWPPRTEQVTGKVVTFYTAGVNVQMKLDNLVKMLEGFRLEDRYFNVDGLAVTWDYPWYEPSLNVRMLFSQALWKAPDSREAGARMPAGGVGGSTGSGNYGNDSLAALQAAAEARALEREAERQANEPGPIGRAWRWIKRNIFYISG